MPDRNTICRSFPEKKWVGNGVLVQTIVCPLAALLPCCHRPAFIERAYHPAYACVATSNPARRPYGFHRKVQYRRNPPFLFYERVGILCPLCERARASGISRVCVRPRSRRRREGMMKNSVLDAQLRVPRGLDGFPLPNTTGLTGQHRLATMRFGRQAIKLPPPLGSGYSDWRPSPPSKEQYALVRRQSQQTSKPDALLFVIMTGGSASRITGLLHNSSLSETCVLPAMTCLVYTDSESTVQVPWPMRIVPPSEYLHDPALPPPKTQKSGECCRKGNGFFFCGAHRKETLDSQYRFLPALAHARRVHAGGWASNRLAWLVMVDDDVRSAAAR